jgi:hypothetical protein
VSILRSFATTKTRYARSSKFCIRSKVPNNDSRPEIAKRSRTALAIIGKKKTTIPETTIMKRLART